MTRPALFLDRDGVINEDSGYTHRIDDFVFMPGIFELCRHARRAGWHLIVVTNQAGIGRGLYTEADFHELTQWMKQRFSMEGAPLDAVYFCPFHPQEGVGEYRRESVFRKPSPGMLLGARDDFAIDMAGSVLVGDKWSDVDAGCRAGVGTTLLYAPGVVPEGEHPSLTATIGHLCDALPYIRTDSSGDERTGCGFKSRSARRSTG